jgi:NitT/TauT family transport system substrate-binding protein
MRTSTPLRRLLVGLLAVVATAGVLAACGSDGSSGSSSGSPNGETLTIGYSAWPGWFVWSVAEEKGFFEKAGVDVKLKYFSDYTASLQALVADQLDGNAQTLNDTLLGIASGSAQVSVLQNDISFGNDAIIVDKSITSIAGLKGKTIAAEQGVVDHFLLLQGLQANGLTEKDISFRNLATDAAAAAFASGQVDGAGVFAPFTVQALERSGSHVLFSSKDFPGTISDHLVLRKQIVDEHPKEVQKLVDAWYLTLDWIKGHADEANAIMAKKAELSKADYADLAEGTKLFTAKEALASFTGTGPTDLPKMAATVNDFLVASGLIPKAANLGGLLDPSFTKANVEANGG